MVGTVFNGGCYLGVIRGLIWGQVPAERIGDYGLWNYLEPAFLYGFSNLLIPSSIFFALVAVTRNVKVVYSASILLLIGYLLSNFLVQDLEKRDLVKLLDPFLINTFQLETRYLTPFKKTIWYYLFQKCLSSIV